VSRAAALKARATLRANRLRKLRVPVADAPAADDFSVCVLCHDLCDRPHECEAILRAREIVAEVASKPLREWGASWVEYCAGNIARRPYREQLDVRALELRLSHLGLVDPLGFAYGVDNVRQRRGGRRAPVGKLPDELARWLENRKLTTYNG
jgi:hypothetical protein